jgi:hypothetical protein
VQDGATAAVCEAVRSLRIAGECTTLAVARDHVQNQPLPPTQPTVAADVVVVVVVVDVAVVVVVVVVVVVAVVVVVVEGLGRLQAVEFVNVGHQSTEHGSHLPTTVQIVVPGAAVPCVSVCAPVVGAGVVADSDEGIRLGCTSCPLLLGESVRRATQPRSQLQPDRGVRHAARDVTQVYHPCSCCLSLT